MKAYAVRETERLESLLEQLAEFEDLSQLNEREYIIFDEGGYADILCERMADSDPEYCPEECYGGCYLVDSLVNNALRIISAGNRVIGALVRKGYWIIRNVVSCEPYEIDYGSRIVESEYADYDGCGFCQKCKRYGTQQCPEDMFSPECQRMYTAYAIERVTDAVSELIFRLH